MSKPPSLPFPNSYWVLPEKLLAGPYPGHWLPDQARLRLRALADCGIQLVINLMEAEEVDYHGRLFVPYLDSLRAFASEAGQQVEWRRFAIRDGSITTQESMRRILDEIDLALAANRPVYVHCWGGKGRTGTVIGCYLARRGLAVGQQALDRISELRRSLLPLSPSPETEAQCQMVLSWKIGE